MLTPAELTVLGLIVEQPRHGYDLEQVIEERGIRQWTDIAFSSIYYVLAKLEKRGLVKRVGHPEDRRSLLIELTKKGRSDHGTLRGTFNEHAVNLMGCVPAAERANVERALLHLRAALTTCLGQCGPDDCTKC